MCAEGYHILIADNSGKNTALVTVSCHEQTMSLWPRKPISKSQPLIYDRNNDNYVICLRVIYLKKRPKRERSQYKIHRTSSKFNIYSLLGKTELCKIENISFKMFPLQISTNY